MDTAQVRKSFDEELQEVKQDILKMGSVVDEMLSGAVRALRDRDAPLASAVMGMDDVVDDYNLAIEARCLRLLALQQPMARDLRTIAGALYIIKDVERMGDYALDVALAARKLASAEQVTSLGKIPEMAEIARRMLRESLQAFVEGDVEAVNGIAEEDDEVDALYRESRDEMIAVMEQDARVAPRAVELVLVARYLERVADHITNVGERIAYMVTGALRELH